MKNKLLMCKKTKLAIQLSKLLSFGQEKYLAWKENRTLEVCMCKIFWIIFKSKYLNLKLLVYRLLNSLTIS